MLKGILKPLLEPGGRLEHYININLEETDFEVVEWVTLRLNFGSELFHIL
jgi:hypothetical protein